VRHRGGGTETAEEIKIVATTIVADKGEGVVCPADAVLTQECGAGEEPDCGGYHTSGKCESYEGIEGGEGSWMQTHGSDEWGKFIEC